MHTTHCACSSRWSGSTQHMMLVSAFPLIAPLSMASAQRADTSAALSGSVSSAASPIVGVEITISALRISTTTDSYGRFRFTGLPPGTHEILVRHVGYTARRDTLTFRSRQEIVRAYTLESVAQLDTVRTTGDEVHYNVPRRQDFEARRHRNVGGYFLSEAELRKNESVSMPSILRRFPGLMVVTYRSQQFVKTRSVGSLTEVPLDEDPHSPKGCWVPVYLDGMLIFDGHPGKITLPTDMGTMFPVNLSGVEFYSGPATVPLQFRTLGTDCGVLLFWTRGR